MNNITPLLIDILRKYYTLADLKTLCAILRINPQEIVVNGKTINECATDLFLYCTNRSIEEQLLSQVIIDRPRVPEVEKLSELIQPKGTLDLLPPPRPPLSSKERQIIKDFLPRTTVTLLFSDIVGYTSWSHKQDEQTVKQLLNEHNDVIRQCIQKHNGYEVKTIGDAFMIAFSIATDAIVCAVCIHCNLYLRNLAKQNNKISVRIGLHSGEVISEGGDFFGNTVNACARIVSLASGNQILVSEAVKVLTEGSVDVEFIDFGEHPLKGFTDKMHLFEIRWCSH